MSEISVNKIRLGRLRGLIDADYDNPDWRGIFENPDDLMSLPGAKTIKDSPTTNAVVVSVEVGGATRSLHVKKLKRRGLLFTLKYLFQRSRARRLFVRHLALIERGVPTLRPVAALSERWGPFLKRSYLITEQLDALPFFTLWEKEIYPEGNLPARRRTVMLAVAKLIALMHRAGVFHRDLKSSNILVKTAGEPVIADLDGAKTARSLSYGQRVRDLARLSTSLVPLANMADRHVFLKTYIAELGTGDNIKLMGRDIVVAGLKILNSKRSKGKYDEYEYRYLDAFARRQREWLDSGA